jgi:hypothetical protein
MVILKHKVEHNLSLNSIHSWTRDILVKLSYTEYYNTILSRSINSLPLKYCHISGRVIWIITKWIWIGTWIYLLKITTTQITISGNTLALVASWIHLWMRSSFRLLSRTSFFWSVWQTHSSDLCVFFLVCTAIWLIPEACFSPIQMEAHVTADMIADFVSRETSFLLTTKHVTTSYFPKCTVMLERHSYHEEDPKRN